jgi:3-deoxy-manno-octulosonate cytidylyltransferase (CMP-KDO synthetase)
VNLIVIPARYASTRFPGKPLHRIAGQPLVQHVWQRCQASKLADACVIATDDNRIQEAAEAFGARVAMTAADHPSGTDRIAEVAHQFPQAQRIVNVQGDEPLIAPALIDSLFTKLAEDSGIDMITAATPISDETLLEDPNVVKVVCTNKGRALYFSRSRLPHPRQADSRLRPLWHKGIYGYQREFLLKFVSWPPGILETVESLEQLRALENGASIQIVETTDDSPGVDTLEQALAVEQRILALRR